MEPLKMEPLKMEPLKIAGITIGSILGIVLVSLIAYSIYAVVSNNNKSTSTAPSTTKTSSPKTSSPKTSSPPTPSKTPGYEPGNVYVSSPAPLVQTSPAPLVAAIACSAGMYSSNGQCTECVEGTFSTEGINNSCTRCALGTFSDKVGGTSCSLCSNNRTTTVLGSTYCTPCPPNHYSSWDSVTNTKGICTTCTLATAKVMKSDNSIVIDIKDRPFTIYPCQKYLFSTNSALFMNPNGELIVYNNRGDIQFRSNTFWPGSKAIFQSSKQQPVQIIPAINLPGGEYGVVRTGIVEDNTNPSVSLYMQGDGELAMYDETGKLTWSSHILYSSPQAVALEIGSGITIRQNQKIIAEKGMLTMLPDGNLVYYKSDGSIYWQSRTSGNPGAYAVFNKPSNDNGTNFEYLQIIKPTGGYVPLFVSNAKGISWLRFDKNGFSFCNQSRDNCNMITIQ